MCRLCLFIIRILLTSCCNRGRRNTYHHTSLIKIDGVEDSDAAKFYAGKRVAYIYKASKAKSGTKLRVIWGKLIRTHGTNGLFRAKFSTNLPVSDNHSFLTTIIGSCFSHLLSEPQFASFSILVAFKICNNKNYNI